LEFVYCLNNLFFIVKINVANCKGKKRRSLLLTVDWKAIKLLNSAKLLFQLSLTLSKFVYYVPLFFFTFHVLKYPLSNGQCPV
jgi:hypothetical protein